MSRVSQCTGGTTECPAPEETLAKSNSNENTGCIDELEPDSEADDSCFSDTDSDIERFA